MLMQVFTRFNFNVNFRIGRRFPNYSFLFRIRTPCVAQLRTIISITNVYSFSGHIRRINDISYLVDALDFSLRLSSFVRETFSDWLRVRPKNQPRVPEVPLFELQNRFGSFNRFGNPSNTICRHRYSKHFMHIPFRALIVTQVILGLFLWEGR